MSFLIGMSGIIAALYYVFTHPHKGFSGFLDPSAGVLIGVVPPCIMLLSHSLSDLGGGWLTLLKASFGRTKKYQEQVIDVLTRCSMLVRSEGIGAVDKERSRVRYELLRDGLTLILSDFSTDEIRHNLEAKITHKQTQMDLAISLFQNMSKVCPGVGMIGTLIGLIVMLSNLKDPKTIGGGMAVAMITTLYGLTLGTMVYAPFGEKIAIEAEKTLALDQMILEGVLVIKQKKSSAHFKDIVKTYTKKIDDPNKQPPRGNR